MTNLTTRSQPGLPARPPLSDLLTASPSVFMACFALGPCRGAAELRDAARTAQDFLAKAGAQTAELRAAAEVLPVDDVGLKVMAFVSAWPNASQGDLAGYGAQLLDDLLSEEPCRHALVETFRRLRRTSKFLPAISEVLTELEVHQSRIRNTLAHIERLPSLIENLTAWAERQERAEADRLARMRKVSA